MIKLTPIPAWETAKGKPITFEPMKALKTLEQSVKFCWHLIKKIIIIVIKTRSSHKA